MEQAEAFFQIFLSWTYEKLDIHLFRYICSGTWKSKRWKVFLSPSDKNKAFVKVQNLNLSNIIFIHEEVLIPAKFKHYDTEDKLY